MRVVRKDVHSIREGIVYETNHKIRFQLYLSGGNTAARRLSGPFTAGIVPRLEQSRRGYFFARRHSSLSKRVTLNMERPCNCEQRPAIATTRTTPATGWSSRPRPVNRLQATSQPRRVMRGGSKSCALGSKQRSRPALPDRVGKAIAFTKQRSSITMNTLITETWFPDGPLKHLNTKPLFPRRPVGPHEHLLKRKIPVRQFKSRRSRKPVLMFGYNTVSK